MRTVKFSRHAKNRMRLHRIKNEEVLSAISDPAYIEAKAGRRINDELKDLMEAS